ncbi:MAG: hypothetical protein KGL93_04880 [Gemmatimonadota bacterium]|nr:hypothetical protein [Gemmatimonadota bacterium]
MPMPPATSADWLLNLNALAGGAFLLVSFGLVALRQVQGCVRLYVLQSVLLATSALLLSALFQTWHLYAVGILDLATKAVLIPWMLRRALHDEIYVRREITQVFNIPTALLMALALAIAAYFLSRPMLAAVAHDAPVALNLPIGLAGLLLGGLTAVGRREAVPLLLGLLAMENSAFFAGIALAPELPLTAEVSVAFDVLVLVFVVAVLTRAVERRTGTTAVGALTTLREDPRG